VNQNECAKPKQLQEIKVGNKFRQENDLIPVKDLIFSEVVNCMKWNHNTDIIKLYNVRIGLRIRICYPSNGLFILFFDTSIMWIYKLQNFISFIINCIKIFKYTCHKIYTIWLLIMARLCAINKIKIIWQTKKNIKLCKYNDSKERSG
jgi:hypothetical protein